MLFFASVSFLKVFYVNVADLIHQMIMFLNAGAENPNPSGKLNCILSPSSEIEVLQSNLSCQVS